MQSLQLSWLPSAPILNWMNAFLQFEGLQWDALGFVVAGLFFPQVANQRNKKLNTSKKMFYVKLQAFCEREIQIAMNRNLFSLLIFFFLNYIFCQVYNILYSEENWKKKGFLLLLGVFLQVFFFLPSFLFPLWKSNVSAVRRMDWCQEIIYQTVKKTLRFLRTVVKFLQLQNIFKGFSWEKAGGRNGRKRSCTHTFMFRHKTEMRDVVKLGAKKKSKIFR